MCNKVLRPKGYIPVLWMIYTAAIQIATEVIFHLKPSLTFCGHISCQNDACLEISFHFAFEYFLLVDVWCRWLRRACPCPNGHCPKCQIGNFWSVGNSSKHRKIHKFMFHALTSRPFINCRNINSQQCWWQSVKKIMSLTFWDFSLLFFLFSAILQFLHLGQIYFFLCPFLPFDIELAETLISQRLVTWQKKWQWTAFAKFAICN